MLSIFPSKSYHLGLTPKNGYIWIYFAWYPSGWWVLPKGYSPLPCSAAEIQEMLQYNIYINYQPYVPTNELNVPTDIQGLVSLAKPKPPLVDCTMPLPHVQTV